MRRLHPSGLQIFKLLWFFCVWEGSNLTVFKSSNFHDVFAHNRRVWCYSFQVWGPTHHLSWWVLQSLKEFQDRHGLLHKSMLTVKGGQNQTGGSSRKWSAFTTSSNKIIRNDGKAVLTRSHNLKVRWIISKKRPKEYKQVSHLLPTNWFLIQASDCIPNPTWMWSLRRGNKQTDEICMWRKGIYICFYLHTRMLKTTFHHHCHRQMSHKDIFCWRRMMIWSIIALQHRLNTHLKQVQNIRRNWCACHGISLHLSSNWSCWHAKRWTGTL